MSVRNLLITGAAALSALALVAGGCGAGSDPAPKAETPDVQTGQAELVTVTPTVELTGLGADGELGSVYVDDLLLHVCEIRLTPADAPEGADVWEYVAEPIWIEFSHETGAVARGLAPLDVPAGKYHVSLTLAPSLYQKRTAGELNDASVVLRGTCIVVEHIEEDEGGPQGPRIPGARSPGFQSNNPVPMPAKPGEGPQASHAASDTEMRARLLQVPFAVKTAASISIDVAEPLDLSGTVGAGALTVRMDVPAWVEAAIHPMVAEVVRAHSDVPDRVVELDFAGEGQEDPMAEILAEIIGKSMADSLSADADQ